MRLSLYLSALAAAAWGTQAIGMPNPPSIRNIFTFPKNHFIENIAVRSNGNLLVTSMSVPHLFSINPTAPSPTATIIHTFPNGTGLMGITELTTPDTFAIVTGIWDLANTRAEPGSLTLWTIDLSAPRKPSHPPKVNLITTIPHSTILNGIAPHPANPSLLLAADSARAALWRINLATGAHDIALESPLFRPTGSAPGTHLGINGLRSAPPRAGRGRGEVYFTNSAQGLFGRVGVDWAGGQVGEVEVLGRSADVGAGDVVYDDIALGDFGLGRGGPTGTAWVAAHPGSVVGVELGRGGRGRQWVVNDTGVLFNPTSAAFGRGGRAQEGVLYVTLGGRFEGMDLVEGGVVAVDLGRYY